MAAARRNAKSARRRALLGLAAGGILAATAWLAGLLWYAAQLPTVVSDAESKTDAIVVLTGGSGRLRQGLELLADGRARKLLVSGVYRGVDVRQLLDAFLESPGGLECCVTLGYQADSTRGNAIETAAWMRDQGFHSLRLVTANYHMPRSLLEFGRTMPDMEIVPHPVMPENFKHDDWWRWPGSASLIVSEYSKYLVAVLRSVIPITGDLDP